MEKELNCSSGQLPNLFFRPNWESSMDQNDPFESALSSIVSSPTASNGNGNGNGGGIPLGDGMMIRELIGRLGSICDSSCIGTGNNSTNTSCYNTPLNSPPSKLSSSSLMMMMENQIPLQFPCFNPDPGFVERAAKNSCFGNTRNVVHKLESGKLSRVLSNQSIRVLGVGENSQMDVNYDKKFGSGEFGDSREGSSLSEQNPGGEMGLKLQNDSNSRKRKSISKAKFKESPSSSLAAKDEKVEAENEESNAKRSKPDEEGKRKNTGESNSNKEKQDNNNDKEAPKDYIHVRARRGQATDSHSLAERVRREKISERMKFLQDLVPGCNKVTGKATVLDEIINYVQSLQRQVEFLSMKLATVNPRMEFNMESFLSKDMFQSRGSSLEHTMYPLDQNSAQAFPFEYLSSQQMPQSLPNGVLNNGIENPFSVNTTGIRRNHSIHLPSIDGFNDSVNQLPTFWEDDLQSIVQMGIAQNQTQSLPGAMPNAQMKVEL